jgi:hypothetical protein
VGSDARQMHAPTGVFDEEHDMQAAQEHGVKVEKPAARMGSE